MKKKKLIILAVILIILIFIIYQAFIKKEEPTFTLFEVARGNVSQEVSETGQVQMGKALKLSFKNSGTITSIFVEVGDEVWPGSQLAQLSTTQLVIERNEAQANLEVAQAKLNQLLEGASPEEIQAAQTDVLNAQVALEDAEQEYQEDLSQAYEDALNILDNAYLKASGALDTVTSIRKTYFSGNDQESITVRSREDNIDMLVASAKEYINEAEALATNESVDAALSFLKNSLNDIYDDLNIIRDMTETTNYRDIVSATNKDLLDSESLNINTALTNTINAQQTITSTRIEGGASVNTAQGNLKEAQDDLALILAEPSKPDIDLYEAQVAQAQAKVDLLNNQIWESTLRSPVQGQVTKINKEVGENWQPSLTESVVIILPADPYEIEVDIYEEDIVKMAVGNAVEVSLIAFPGETFQGKVISINPAEELIEGVVYYTVTIGLEETPEGLRPGMTADLVIRTSQKENVINVPEDAISEKEGKNVVQVFKDGKTEEREVETGVVGSDDMVEIVSGLVEGEQVVIE